jgi:hypothetical protein
MEKPQIYGWTEPALPPDGQYVRYVMAFKEGENIRLEIRNCEGKTNDIVMPCGDAAELATALVTPDDRLDGTKPIVMFFGSDEDRDEMVAAVMEAKPNMISRKL